MYTNIHVFDSPQQISIIKYDPKKYKTQIVQAPQMTMTSHLAKENQAEAAINGSYFNVKTGAPTTFIRLDGIVRGETTRAEAFRTDGAISTDKNKIKIHAFDSITSKKLGKKYKNILAAGPLLLKNGVRQMAPTFPENTGKATKGNALSSDVPQGFFKRHPRAFIGITPDNQIMMVVVDGRFKKHSVGMSIDELSYLAKQLGMRDALNLDGGGSSTLWNNKTGIVNHPYDNKKFDHEGEREVSNAILVIPNCSEKESIPEGIIPPTDSVSSKIEIKNFSIEAQIHTSPDSTVTMQGEGFLQSDTVALISETAANNTYALPLASVTKQSADIVMPKNIVSDTYQLWLKRETDSCRLGKTTLIIENAVDLNIPDIAGMTLKGVVYCENKPLPNVVVSDGYNVVQTDEQGRYYIQSDKKSGFVFISVPGNYEVAIKDNNQPVFFYRLAKDDSVEQHDFELTATDNTNHVLLALADMHLANRNNDLSQFKLRFLPDLNTTVEKYRSEGKKVYGLTLGDMTWDQYWYSNRYDLSKYLITIKSVDLPIFNCTGNHDNNPYCADDWQAEQAYKDIIGPTYYSFNLGNVHYIVLDNIQYINTGASQGTIGKRNYNKKLTEDQLSWLKKDLATVTDKNAPLFVAMHAQLYANPTSLPQKNTISMSGGSTLVNYLKEFTNAHVITGHTHINYTIEPSNQLIEHNIAAVCATWWWTGKNGYANNHICKDGSPGGYKIFSINDNDVKWLYKGIKEEESKQFRSYDLNQCHITAEAFAPKSTEAEMGAYSDTYGTKNNKNEILVNVWGYDPEWKVEMTENGKPLEVTRVVAKDPLHIISYEAKRLDVGATPTADFVSCATAHMFKATASNATSTIEIKVTDRFGNTYSETMNRPKSLSCSMK